jgi:hypothetical protein
LAVTNHWYDKFGKPGMTIIAQRRKFFSGLPEKKSITLCTQMFAGVRALKREAKRRLLTLPVIADRLISIGGHQSQVYFKKSPSQAKKIHQFRPFAQELKVRLFHAQR